MCILRVARPGNSNSTSTSMPNILRKPFRPSNSSRNPLEEETRITLQHASSSRTMAMATSDIRQTDNPPTWSTRSSLTPVQRPQQQAQPQAMTATEQYWATRALRAEALLEAHLTHKKEAQTVGEAHDVRREVCIFRALQMSLLTKEGMVYSVKSMLLRRNIKKNMHH